MYFILSCIIGRVTSTKGPDQSDPAKFICISAQWRQLGLKCEPNDTKKQDIVSFNLKTSQA